MQDDSHSLGLILAGLGLFMFVRSWDKLLAFLMRPSTILVVVLILLCLTPMIFMKLKKIRAKNIAERAILEKSDDSVFCGVTDKNEDVWIKPRQRTMHTQIVGTTNAGKTESVILPWAIQDIHAGKGMILIDGKADNSLLDKLWAYTVNAKREKDFRLFSLGHLEESNQFNPLIGGTAEEITERVFNAFEFENPYYRSLQYEVMGQVMRIFDSAKVVPTFEKLYQAIANPLMLEKYVEKIDDVAIKSWLEYYKGLSNNERDMRTSGLLAVISHFSTGKTSILFNADQGEKLINLDEALKNNQIIYFQLPVLLSPFLGKATGKLVLQCLQAAVANRHRAKDDAKKFFSVFLDDFSEYLYPGFVSILNKSRSANIGVVFAHQALGDIQTLGDPIANAILTNSNIKIFMRGNDPDSAEYFSKVIGTVRSTKYTERQKQGLFQKASTGDVSARDVEEFVIHPNAFKREIGVGEAMMLIPHERGTKTIKIKFQKLDDLPAQALPKVTKMKPVQKPIVASTTHPNQKPIAKVIFKTKEAV